MSITLNHTIVPAHDKEAAARFFADMFGLKYEGASGHFAPVKVNETLTMDFDNRESFESQSDKRPLTTFVANPGGAPAAGNTTRVLASDLTNISGLLSSKFNYQTGPFEGITKEPSVSVPIAAGQIQRRQLRQILKKTPPGSGILCQLAIHYFSVQIHTLWPPKLSPSSIPPRTYADCV